MRKKQNNVRRWVASLALLVLIPSGPACTPQRLAAAGPDTEGGPTPHPPRAELLVTTTADSGKGSLRQTIRKANASKGPDTIRFDSVGGPFATPQTIRLARPLPPLVGELIIDGYIEDRLWKPTGVTVSGAGHHQVFRVARGAEVTLRFFSIADGDATRGAGVVNQGKLVVRGMTFVDNVAEEAGGGLANLAGSLAVINSTFVNNQAGHSGGAIASLDGPVTVTNCTFSGNAAEKGGGLYSTSALLLRNTILANSERGADCEVTGTLDPASTHNLIERNEGCGTPISTADPRLRRLGGYNGPTRTLPLGGGSPAVNLGDNASALDEHGQPLRWDQRGNGDPRFAAGITDIGAFERQGVTLLTVDTLEDAELRACTRGPADCSLRGAITLANATGKTQVIRFDPKVFSVPRTIRLTHPLPDVAIDLTLDATGTAGVTASGDPVGLQTAPNAKLTLHGIRLDGTR